MEFLRSNTAVITPVGPFLDKTDGVTLETALTITNERITLIAATDAGSAPTLILDNITGATSGTANDLNYITSNDAGMMQIELAAGDVNRVGRMKLLITDAANHCPVEHNYFVLPQAIYDWFTGVIVPLPANVTQLLGTAWLTPGTAGTPDVNIKLAGGTAWASGAITAAVIADAAIDRASFAADTGLQSIRSGTAQSGTGTTIRLDTGASAIDDFYGPPDNTVMVLLVSGTGAGQTAISTDYVGSTRDLTIDRTWITTPDNTTGYVLFPAPSTSEDVAAAVWAYATRILTAATNLTTALATPTNITAGTITTVTNLTNAPTAGDLTATMKTSVNTEVLDVLNTDTFAEPGQEAPGATVSLVKKIGYLYKAFRNRATQTATAYKLYNDDAATVDQKRTVSDDATTFDSNEIVSGP